MHFHFYVVGTILAKKLLKRNSYDIIHHMLPSVYGQSLSPLAFLNNTLREPFVLGPISCHVFKRPLDEKILTTFTKILHLKTVQKCSKIIAINEIVKKLYENIIDEEKICIIPFGVDDDLFIPSKKHIERERFEILYVGSLIELKGVFYLINALPYILKNVSDVTLRIVGEGKQKSVLQKLVHGLDLDENVVFEGFVPHPQIHKFFQKCDVFCFPTLGEPFGKAIIEAMACGKAVIATNIGGSSEIIQNDVNGILIPPRNETAIATEILELISNRRKRVQLGENARKTVEKKYSWKIISRQLHEFYLSLI